MLSRSSLKSGGSTGGVLSSWSVVVFGGWFGDYGGGVVDWGLVVCWLGVGWVEVVA